jgi:hypothetical protein
MSPLAHPEWSLCFPSVVRNIQSCQPQPRRISFFNKPHNANPNRGNANAERTLDKNIYISRIKDPRMSTQVGLAEGVV